MESGKEAMGCNCEKCGVDLPIGTHNFCPTCGYKFPVPMVVNPSSSPINQMTMKKKSPIVVFGGFLAIVIIIGVTTLYVINLCKDVTIDDVKNTFISSNVDRVKSSRLDIDKGISVGQAFDNYKYFNSIWKEFQAENGRQVVQVECLVSADNIFTPEMVKKWDKALGGGIGEIEKSVMPNLDKLKSGFTSRISNLKIVFQFSVNQDDTFKIQYAGYEMIVTKDGKQKQVQESLESKPLMQTLKDIYNNEPLALYIGIAPVAADAAEGN